MLNVVIKYNTIRVNYSIHVHGFLFCSICFNLFHIRCEINKVKTFEYYRNDNTVTYILNISFFLAFTGNGKIEFNEFLTLMERNLNSFESEELIRSAFKVIDQHGKGYITYQQLHQVKPVVVVVIIVVIVITIITCIKSPRPPTKTKSPQSPSSIYSLSSSSTSTPTPTPTPTPS